MKPTESQIENILRHAPRPCAPAGLKDKLAGQIQLRPATTATASSNGVSPLHPAGWWQRWWPVLAPATASLAFAVVLMVQQNEITTLKQTISDLDTTLAAASGSEAVNIQSAPAESVITPANTQEDEIAQLKQRVAALTTEIGQLEAVQKGNESLRTQIDTPAGLSQPELDALAEAKERAQSIRCINNLKQVGLAVRLWAIDNNGVNPPDFLTMSNELSTPKILFCPGNTNHPPVNTWAEFAATVSSYEFLAAGVTNGEADPERILTRCPVHNNIGLCDGSVQKVGKDHPERTVERGGKLYLDMIAQPPNPATNP